MGALLPAALRKLLDSPGKTERVWPSGGMLERKLVCQPALHI